MLGTISYMSSCVCLCSFLQENPFDDHAGPSNSQQAVAPTFTVALGDPLEICRAIGKIPSYMEYLEETNRALKKENKALRARVRELENACKDTTG